MKRFIGFIFVCLLLMGVHVTPAHAADYTVCTSGCTHTTIAAAIIAASNGDTITVMNAVHTEQGITVDKELTIQGQGVANTIVQAHASPNTATDGVFIVTSNVTIQNMTIRHGNSVSGGGIYNGGGTVTVNNSTLSGNSASLHGGGIRNNGGMVTFSNSTLSHNSASSLGGGIYNSIGGTLMFSNSILFRNSASYGGGIRNSGTVTFSNSTISGNSASLRGGGIGNVNGTATVSNSTLFRNSASSHGGGIRNSGGTVTVSNSIIANSLSGGDCNGTLTSGGYNLYSDNSCSLAATGDIPNSNPLLGALADNGGLTRTHALLIGSPAIDQIPVADPNCNPGVTTDQRGAARANGAGSGSTMCDMGAFEYDSNFTPTAVSLQSLSATNPSLLWLIAIPLLTLLAINGWAFYRKNNRVLS